jgi:type II secretory pathway component PulM
MELSQREKLLLLVACVILLPLLGFRYIYLPIANQHQRTLQKISTLKAKNTRIGELGRKIKLLSHNSTRKPGEITGRINRLLKQQELKAKSTISMGTPPPTGQKLSLKLVDIDLSQLVRLVYKLEDEKPTLIIEKFELTPSFKSKKLLRVNINVVSR